MASKHSREPADYVVGGVVKHSGSLLVVDRPIDKSQVTDRKTGEAAFVYTTEQTGDTEADRLGRVDYEIRKGRVADK